MLHLFVSVARNFQNMRKSPRVADENMFEAAGNNGVELVIFGRERGGGGGGGGRRRHGWSGLSLVCSVLHAPISILSCVCHPHVNSSDGVWVSGEFPQISEMNHLMVSDSMRYAILM